MAHAAAAIRAGKLAGRLPARYREAATAIDKGIMWNSAAIPVGAIRNSRKGFDVHAKASQRWALAHTGTDLV